MMAQDPVILLVEDEREVRTELTRFLQRFSHTVISAENGEEGLAFFRSHAPDIVISDIRMPKMNGIEMAKAIKKIAPEQPIVFTTAHGDNGYFIEAIEMQIDGYILKPVDLGLLKKKIQDINKKLKAEKERKLYTGILDDIAQMQDSMLAVYDEKATPVFFNKKLLRFLGHATLEDFRDACGSLGDLFEEKDGCFHPETHQSGVWVQEIQKVETDKRLVSLKSAKDNQSHLFLVSLSKQTQNSNVIATFSEVTSIIEKNRQYMHDAYTDSLTQIPNRARFNLLFDEAMERCKTKRSDLNMILMDIDNFKAINDRHGHSVGDAILKEFTTLVSKHIRVDDLFSRWGGEEFVLLLPKTSTDHAKKIAENLQSVIEKHDFGIGEKMTCSFGVAGMKNGDRNNQLFERVDQALYRAKDKGRNRVEVSRG